MINAIRVACLYRVSTRHQAEGDDIPMQRMACRHFAQSKPGWQITKEYIEKGVSGYHKSTAQRDVLQKIIKDADGGWFDVLLVFMFDRLGRREDEISVLVEWLNAKRIEVWSVKEGPQRFDNRGDRLINYIRYWQSAGESEKTAIRVAEKHRQLVEAGQFRGGPPPYGYELVYSGEHNRRGHERKKLTINHTESEIVKTIYALCVNDNWGSYKIARYLNDKKIPTKKGNPWTVQAVVRLLQNPVYKGDYVSGKVKNRRGKKTREDQTLWIHSRERLQELVIVDEKTWAGANLRIQERRASANPSAGYTELRPLSGIAFCGHCGTKLIFRPRISSKTSKRTGKSAKYIAYTYCCPKKMRQGACEGQFGYGARKVEAMVMNEVQNALTLIRKADLRDRLLTEIEKQFSTCAKEKALADKAILSAEEELSTLNNEIITCLAGESAFTSEQLTQKIDASEAKLKCHHETRRRQIHKAQVLTAKSREIETNHLMPDCLHVFDTASLDEKAFLVKTATKSIFVYRDKIDIHFEKGLSYVKA